MNNCTMQDLVVELDLGLVSARSLCRPSPPENVQQQDRRPYIDPLDNRSSQFNDHLLPFQYLGFQGLNHSLGEISQRVLR